LCIALLYRSPSPLSSKMQQSLLHAKVVDLITGSYNLSCIRLQTCGRSCMVMYLFAYSSTTLQDYALVACSVDYLARCALVGCSADYLARLCIGWMQRGVSCKTMHWLDAAWTILHDFALVGCSVDYLCKIMHRLDRLWTTTSLLSPVTMGEICKYHALKVMLILITNHIIKLETHSSADHLFNFVILLVIISIEQSLWRAERTLRIIKLVQRPITRGKQRKEEEATGTLELEQC